MHLGSYNAFYTDRLRVFRKTFQTLSEIQVRIGRFGKNIEYAREIKGGILPRFLILAFATVVKIHTYLFANLGQ